MPDGSPNSGVLVRRPAVAAAASFEPAIRQVPTLFVDCTNTYRSKINTGIQRVVRNILRHAPEIAAAYGLQVVPVVFDGDVPRFVSAASVLDGRAEPGVERPTIGRITRLAWRIARKSIAMSLPFGPVRRFLYAPAHEPGLAALIRGKAVQSELDLFDAIEGSTLLLLDSSWDLPLWPAVHRFKARGGRIASVIYDLIPLTHPQSAVGDLPAIFRRWLEAHAAATDGFLCISAATANELRRFLAPRKHAPIAHFHLGSELDLARPSDSIRPAIRTLFGADRQVFLMVGSIEPRKRHAFALDAFERHWRQGGKGILVIIGCEGWRSDTLLQRIAHHPELEKRLFLIRDAGDAELNHAYCHADALIMPSEAEGFGLPIAEAFQHGLPVLCSDIPVFREVAKTGATFFPLDDPAGLAALLSDFKPPVARRRGSWLTWRDSTAQLFEALDRTQPPSHRRAGETRQAAG